jgi:hypothetical protein
MSDAATQADVSMPRALINGFNACILALRRRGCSHDDVVSACAALLIHHGRKLDLSDADLREYFARALTAIKPKP